MSAESATPQLDTAHVLFMDLVGYSAVRPMEAQRQLLEELQTLVRQVPEFERVRAGDDYLRLPTGDGMAIVFFRDPVAPIRCAMQLARVIKASTHLKLRMGVHSGPVYRLADINENVNVSGTGINLAQRVMDCGDAGHILLSAQVMGLVSQVGAWPAHDLGAIEVKHGEKLHLFNLYTDEIGNPALPERLRLRAPSGRPVTPAGRGSTSGIRVALLYKRHVEPDAHVLALLEERLTAAGCRVFVDRHLQIGVEWAGEIERQLREADAVIPLLSASSIQSEMLEWEVERAHRASQEHGGKPRILPVRLAYSGPLPDPLATALDPLEYAAWDGPDDDARLAADLLLALENPTPPAPVPAEKLEPVGGAVPLDSAFYVVRSADAQFMAAIERRDSIILVKGARQMGKTSLLARGLQQARRAGARIARTDFQKLNVQHLESADAFFQRLAGMIADQLDLDVMPEDLWQERRGPSENFERYWRRAVLREVSEPVVWGLDEVDRLFSCSFASEVFGLFRSWHNERALDPDGPWRRLTLAIAYTTEAHLFITDVNQSPFNVGTRLTLDDFSYEQVVDLNRRHGNPLPDEASLTRFVRLLGGHPYLVRRALNELAGSRMEIATFEREAARDEGPFGDHLRRILVLLARDPALMEVVRQTLAGGSPPPDAHSFFRLRSAGVMAGESATDMRPRCQLYETYLRRHLL